MKSLLRKCVPMMLLVFACISFIGCSNTDSPALIHPSMTKPGNDVHLQVKLSKDAVLPKGNIETVYQHLINIDTTTQEASKAINLDLTSMKYSKSNNRRFYKSDNKFCTIEEDTGYWTYVVEDELQGIPNEEFLGDDRIADLAKSFLRDKLDYQSSDYAITVVPITTGGWGNEEKTVAKSAYIYPTVNGKSVYGVFRIMLTFDNDGNITEIYKTAGDVAKYSDVPLKTINELAACLKRSDYIADAPDSLKDALVKKVSLAYYADAAPNEKGEFLIYPVYILQGEGTAENGNKEAFSVTVDAVR